MSVQDQILGRDVNLNPNWSKIYSDLVYNILSNGIETVCEDKFATYKRYVATFRNPEYAITFNLELTEPRKGVTPALSNFVYDTSQAKKASLPEGELIDKNYVKREEVVLNTALAAAGVSDFEALVYNYPSLILRLIDYMTDYINEVYDKYGNIPQDILMELNQGIEFGGIVVYPVIQNDGIFYRYELSFSLRYLLKRDVIFTSED